MFTTTQFKKIIRNKKLESKSKKGREELDTSDTLYDYTNLDENCLYDLSTKIVRIEYPGKVQNIDRVIETLGGRKTIETAVEDSKSKLELRFHPKNWFNKGCTADRDTNPGILIKVAKNKDATTLSEKQSLKYEIIGATGINFKFNRLIDFQYLPLITQKSQMAEDDDESEAEYIHDKILPTKIPDLEWFLQKENVQQELFITPYCYARFDTPHKLYINTAEKYANSGIANRPDLFKYMEDNYGKLAKRPSRIPSKHVSIFVDLSKKDAVIPDQPRAYTMELIREKSLENRYQAIKKIFQERPIWTKAAILCISGINLDISRIILPAIGYFCYTGPFRNCWIRFGYNPLRDYNSRIYQTLDYRIRAGEGTKLKVEAKRNYSSRIVKTQGNPRKLFPSEDRNYILRPDYIPPARQMFYQYCDIKIPEIQEMVTKLPRLPPSAKYDLKNGWLPSNFTEQCREIANKYIMNAVKNAFLEDIMKEQEQPSSSNAQNSSDNANIATYCSTMLNNIRRGIYKTVDASGESTINIGQVIDLETENTEATISNQDEEFLQMDVNQMMNSIPERIEEDLDEEEISDMEIDLEAAEEVNSIILGIRNVI